MILLVEGAAWRHTRAHYKIQSAGVIRELQFQVTGEHVPEWKDTKYALHVKPTTLTCENHPDVVVQRHTPN